MFDIGGWELALAAVIALIVVKPEDIPSLMKTVGKYLGKLRALSAEFRHHMDSMIEEAEFDEIVNSGKQAGEEIKKISAADFTAFSDMMPDIIDSDEDDDNDEEDK